MMLLTMRRRGLVAALLVAAALGLAAAPALGATPPKLYARFVGPRLG